MTEKEVERKLVRMIAKHGGYCLKWVCPGWLGVPDRIILLPRGRVIFAELKRPQGGRIGKPQKVWRDRLARLGFDHYFVQGDADIMLIETRLIREGYLWDPRKSRKSPHGRNRKSMGSRSKRSV